MDRVERVREKMREHDVDGLVISNDEEGKVDIRYLTGFTGSRAFCLITGDSQYFLTDGRYDLQSRQEVDGWDILIHDTKSDLWNDITQKLSGVERIGLVKDKESWGFQRELEAGLDSCELVALPDIVAEVRSVKDDAEVDTIRRAIRQMESVLRYVFTLIKPGVSDRELATELKIALMRRGLEISFSPIIVSGAHSAIVHGNPFELPNKKVAEGDIIQFDVGCWVDGYSSDISRVAVCGMATDKQRKMHAALMRAINEAVKLYRPGVVFEDANKLAKGIMEEEGFPKFSHGLGHGLGMEVHEPPYNFDVFEVGNVVTVEPGIYIEGYGGMRIERDVLITKSGSRYLDRLSTALKEVPIK